ncbi:MAG: N-acetyltransferase family protein [Granulosicoccus sp.]
MAVVRRAHEEDIEAICTLLHTKMNSRIPIERWRQLMTYTWLEPKPDFGRVVVSKGQILGFCGMVYSDRLIGDAVQGYRKERMVSMSSWYLDKSLRGQGLGREMLLSSIEDPALTYATLTNSKKPLAIVEGLGFKKLEDHRYVWSRSNHYDFELPIYDDPADIREQLAPELVQIVDDMQNMPVMPLLVGASDRQALIFLSIKRKKDDVLWFDLMYSSDLEMFSNNAQSLANSLLPNAGKSAVLAADGRFVRQPSRGAVRESLPVARYYVSQRVEPYEIDHLYSELQLLDLKLD